MFEEEDYEAEIKDRAVMVKRQRGSARASSVGAINLPAPQLLISNYRLSKDRWQLSNVFSGGPHFASIWEDCTDYHRRHINIVQLDGYSHDADDRFIVFKGGMYVCSIFNVLRSSSLNMYRPTSINGIPRIAKSSSPQPRIPSCGRSYKPFVVDVDHALTLTCLADCDFRKP